MIQIDLKDPMKPNLIGDVDISLAPSYLCKEEALRLLQSIHSGNNLIVDTAETVIAGLMMRNTADYLPYYINLGSGGDLTQIGRYDAGQRVPPAATDTSIRESIIKLPIIKVDPISSNQWTYTAIAEPQQGLTTSLNELTLESYNGTLISHYVTPAPQGEIRAKRLVKTSLYYLIVRWTFTLNLA